MAGRFSLIVFDLDGVIVDSTVATDRAVDAALEAVGIVSVPPEARKLLFGPPLYVGFAALLEAVGADPSLGPRCADVYRDHYREFVVAESRIHDGMLDVLDSLLPLTPLAVATSKPREFTVLVLDRLTLNDHFVFIAAPESEAEMEQKSTTLARCLESQRNPPGAVHVGDTVTDVVAARANDLPCIGVLWGYGTRRELEEAGASWLAPTPPDLLQLLTER